MTQRLIFHGKNSEESLVILEGRAPAQATGDGTRLVRVRQSTITTEGKGSMYFIELFDTGIHAPEPIGARTAWFGAVNQKISAPNQAVRGSLVRYVQVRETLT